MSSPTSESETRERLLKAAIAVFAEHGFHAASTREICGRADANSAAIHYHFGDKAALYREAFQFGLAETDDPSPALATLPRRDALARFYRSLLAPLAGNRLHQQLLRLHAREEVEPSGVLGDTVARAVRPRHEQLTALLVRELGIAKPDLEVERLAVALVGMATVFYHARHVLATLEPRLIAGRDWLGTLSARLADYASSLVDAEAARRKRAREEAKA